MVAYQDTGKKQVQHSVHGAAVNAVTLVKPRRKQERQVQQKTQLRGADTEKPVNTVTHGKAYKQYFEYDREGFNRDDCHGNHGNVNRPNATKYPSWPKVNGKYWK